MRKPTELRSPVGRFLGAFVGFLAIIGGGVVFLTYGDGDLEHLTGKTSPAETTSGTTQPDALFYKRLGTSPIVNNEIKTNGAKSKGPGDGYTIEIKVTETRQEAEQLIDSLREKGVDAYYTPIAVRGRVQYRVRYGIYSDSKSAQAASRKIDQGFSVKNKVIKLR